MSLKDPRRQKQLEKLMQKLGLSDTTSIKWHLIDLALTHSSAASANYEQLEFVGDAVVRLAASELLLEIYPDFSVGEFSALRKVLVSDRILSMLADSYGMDNYLIMSDSAAGDLAAKTSRLADTFEAVLGALYLSTHNLQLIRPWLDGHLQRLAKEIHQDPARQNYKEALQGWTQAHYQILPEYRVKETENNTDPAYRFTAEVWLKGDKIGKGKGSSKKASEQMAAKEAFLILVNPS